MSFSNDVKNEVARLEGFKDCCERSELFGLLRMSGAVSLRGRGVGINFTTENAALARRVLQLLKGNFNVQTEVVVIRSRRLKKNNRYQVRVLPSTEAGEALDKLELLSLPQEGSSKLLGKACCRRAFLRGVFLAGGSVSKPVSDYHLELVTENADLARLIQKTMLGFSLPAKITDRKNHYIVYLKEGNAVTVFLSIIGAHSSLLEFENIRIVKEMRNNVNRLVNCETANLGKVVQASVRQLACIEYLDEAMGLHNLPPLLLEAALLRREHQEASVAELAALARGAIGKSGFNHRLRKLEKIAKDMGMEK